MPRKSEAERFFERALKRKSPEAKSEPGKPSQPDRRNDLASLLKKRKGGKTPPKGAKARKPTTTHAAARGPAGVSGVAPRPSVAAVTPKRRPLTTSTGPSQPTTAIGTPPPTPSGGGQAPVAPAPIGGIEIMAGTENTPPHTYKTAEGKHCATDRWFDRCFLCFNPALPENAAGGKYNPWLGLSGRGFRCYYPGSSSADFKAIMTSGSSGRWLQSWSQKSHYTRF